MNLSKEITQILIQCPFKILGALRSDILPDAFGLSWRFSSN